MKDKIALIFIVFLLMAARVIAQKPFVEGVISYKIQIMTTDNKTYKGTYTFSFKNGHIRKDLKLNSGYEDVVLINSAQNTAYSLQTKNGKKYAIQLSMGELNKKQSRYVDFELKEKNNDNKKIAGYAVSGGKVIYKDGSSTDIYYTPDWCPDKTLTFERFPNAKFMPLYCSFKDEKGISMIMEAEKVSAAPVENRIFMLPDDYKVIAYNEYQQLSK